MTYLEFLICGIIFVIPAVIVMLLVISVAVHFEKKRFNKGFCPECGKKLKLFTIDSMGGREYKCPDWHYSTWITYTHVYKDFIEESEEDVIL